LFSKGKRRPFFQNRRFARPLKGTTRFLLDCGFFYYRMAGSCIPLYKKADNRDYPHKLSALRLIGSAPLRPAL
jgi:hypothetical protein